MIQLQKKMELGLSVLLLAETCEKAELQEQAWKVGFKIYSEKSKDYGECAGTEGIAISLKG